MARIRPVGSSGGSPTHSGGSHGHRHKGRHPRVRHPRPRHPRAPKADNRAPTPEPVSAASAWSHTATTPGTIPPLMTLAPTATGAPSPLVLSGAQRGSLSVALAAWERQRDQALSRIWRRPGGLAHLAGT